MSDQPKPKILLKKSLLQTVRNAIGIPLFRNLCVELDGKEIDVLEDGNLSCAAFVSGILAMYGLIDEGHTTVDNTVKYMKEAGWFETDLASPETGDVIVWGEVQYADGPHKHIGFYVGNGQAISNSDKPKSPQQHDWTFNGTRQPTLLLRYDFSKKETA